MIMIIFWQEKIYFLPDDFHKKDIDCTLGKAAKVQNNNCAEGQMLL